MATRPAKGAVFNGLANVIDVRVLTEDVNGVLIVALEWRTSEAHERRVGQLLAQVGLSGPAFGQATDLFFSEDLYDIAHAKHICRSCDVREACFEGTLARREPWGVWGGELFANGKVLAQKRRRGRPPKVRPPEPQYDYLARAHDFRAFEGAEGEMDVFERQERRHGRSFCCVMALRLTTG